MRKTSFMIAIAFAAATILIGCGSNMMNTTGGGTVPMSLSIKDNPPAGVTVLAFEL